MRKRVTSWAVPIAALWSGVAFAHVPLGPEFQVNTALNAVEAEPSVAATGQGTFIVAWASHDLDAGVQGIAARRYHASGIPADAIQFQVNSYTTGFQQRPSVASNGEGHSVVVWDRFDLDSGYFGVFGQRYDATGAVGTQFKTSSPQETKAPAVAVSPDGTFVVVWEGPGQDGFSDVLAQRFGEDGIPAGDPFRINETTAKIQGHAAVAMEGQGNFVVVWASELFPLRWGVFGRRYDAAGVAQGGEFSVASGTTVSSYGAAVALDADGDFVVVWTSRGVGSFESDVFGRMYEASGIPKGAEFQVNSYTAGWQYEPAVACDGAGNFVVAWTSRYQDGSDVGVFAQRHHASGAPIGGEFQVNTYTTRSQREPAVAMHAGGDFVIVWNNADVDSVFGQRFGADLIFEDGFEWPASNLTPAIRRQ